MATEFSLPDVGEGLAEAEIVRWLVQIGDDVREDQAIVEVETDKALVQITSPVTGTLTEQAAAEGEIVPVGSLLAVFDGDADSHVSMLPDDAGRTAADAEGASVPESEASSDGVGHVPETPSATTSGSRKPKATPATRKLARELNVDLTTATGSGPSGRILDEDVRRAAEGGADASVPGRTSKGSLAPTEHLHPLSSAGAAPSAGSLAAPTGEDQRVPMRGIRKAVARTMTASWETIPHVNSIHEVDLRALQELRSQLNDADRAIPVTAFVVKAVARALRRFPVLNAEVDADAEEMVLKHRVNIGVAVDAPDGLIVPVIEDADVKRTQEIGIELRRLAEQARDRSLSPERLRGGTFTVNNYGPLGGWFGTSLVKPPEVGILSLGPTRDQVVPRDGEVVIRPIAVMTLAADHRVADGREVIGFCLAVRHALEAPVSLLMEE